MAVTVPAPARLWQLATGHFLPRCLHVIAELGAADHIDDEPVTTDALARATRSNADALGRMLRLLAVAGIFEARADGWAHTELSRPLRSDHPQSMRAFARMIGGALNWAAAGELQHAAQTGETAISGLAPGGMWAYLREHPEQARIFDAAMTAKSAAEIAALVPAFDFARYATIADIGGGRGHILLAALAAAPRAKGILFDQPDVVASVLPHPQLDVQGGDFFRDPLPVADAYIVGNVLHDWADAEAIAILRAIRGHAPGHAELLVLESLLPERPEPSHAIVLDLIMLTLTGGRERTRGEYEVLLEAAGFRLQRVVPTAGPVSVIVGVPAG
jgi:hypothetical protein